VKALDGFIDRLRLSTGPVSKGVVESAKDAVLDPIDQSISDQRRLLRRIKEDLQQTEEEQRSTRNELDEQETQLESLRARYEELMADIEELAGS